MTHLSEAEALEFQQQFNAVVDSVSGFIRGKDDVVRNALVCLLTEGHLLLEDVPGVGKTSLARAFAAALGCDWQRVQCTPDLLPSDITGVAVYHQKTEEFVFHDGPVFTNILVADEINRTSPRTQSALLEVMEEQTVTVDGQPKLVPRPFMVIATQNPVEMSGTYPLPEAQLDRFMMKLSMGYPDRDAETAIIESHHSGATVGQVQQVADAAAVQSLIAQAARVHVSRSAARYVVDFTQATRQHPAVQLGASPRAGIALLRAARVLGAAQGRHYILPGDVIDVAEPLLGHRLVLEPSAQTRGVQIRDVLADVEGSVRVSLELTDQ
ncbi:MAG: AAA family ATPase [Candidatus Nanopelagicales bacterium]